MQRLLHKINRLMPLLFWLLIAITSFLMLIELPPKTDGLPYVDKIVHAIIFAALTFTGLLAYSHKKRHILLGLMLLGAAYEILQAMFTFTRKASMVDWLADVAGIVIAFGVIVLINSKKNHVRV